MLQQLKFKDAPESRVYFTSDLHLNHKPEFIWKARGYNSIQEHNSGVIEKINSIVRAQDVLFNLGDLFLNTQEEQAIEILDKINCQNIYSCWGNHGFPLAKIYKREVAKQYSPGIEVYPFRFKNLIFIGDYLEVIINGKVMILSHYPLAVFNHSKYGAYSLSGHSHYGYEKTQAQHKEGLMLDVGWDGHGKPLSFEEINNIMATKTIKQEDNHH